MKVVVVKSPKLFGGLLRLIFGIKRSRTYNLSQIKNKDPILRKKTENRAFGRRQIAFGRSFLCFYPIEPRVRFKNAATRRHSRRTAFSSRRAGRD